MNKNLSQSLLTLRSESPNRESVTFLSGDGVDYHYTLFIDEAGDDKLGRLRPKDSGGNSEWLCLGGYLVKSSMEADLERRRDDIRRAIGGLDGQVLHYRNLNQKNRRIAASLLASKGNSAKGYVVCSCKRTMQGYRNARAEAVLGPQHRDTLYNYACRILLERVTNFVANHGRQNGIEKPILRIVMASRKGHHFGQFKAYIIGKLIPQAIGGTTFQDTRTINPHVLRGELIERAPASQEAGLQLADTLVSAFFQSVEQHSRPEKEPIGLLLRPLMARNTLSIPRRRATWAREGVTLYHPSAARSLTKEQKAFFEAFGYNINFLATRKTPKAPRFTQEERLWSNSLPDLRPT